ncbi:eCIS core domain-containing protein [Nostoc sp.]|uniref:eCIS core domain-containing protein n=1 Tax=Nostoc sp. TaxID=1180 RepID=UPI003FA55BCF
MRDNGALRRKNPIFCDASKPKRLTHPTPSKIFADRAFTTGQDLFFRNGEYNPGSRNGQELIAYLGYKSISISISIYMSLTEVKR